MGYGVVAGDRKTYYELYQWVKILCPVGKANNKLLNQQAADQLISQVTHMNLKTWKAESIDDLVNPINRHLRNVFKKRMSLFRRSAGYCLLVAGLQNNEPEIRRYASMYVFITWVLESIKKHIVINFVNLMVEPHTENIQLIGVEIQNNAFGAVLGVTDVTVRYDTQNSFPYALVRLSVLREIVRLNPQSVGYEIL